MESRSRTTTSCASNGIPSRATSRVFARAPSSARSSRRSSLTWTTSRRCVTTTGPRSPTGLIGRALRQQLVDRGEAGQEAIPRRPQVEAPDAGTLGAGQADGVVEPGVQALDPVGERRRVVLAQVLDVAGLEASALDRLGEAR